METYIVKRENYKTIRSCLEVFHVAYTNKRRTNNRYYFKSIRDNRITDILPDDTGVVLHVEGSEHYTKAIVLMCSTFEWAIQVGYIKVV